MSRRRTIVDDVGEVYAVHNRWIARHVGHPIDAARRDLRGKDGACWCPLCPTHADGLPLGVVCGDCAPCHVPLILVVANDWPDTAYTGAPTSPWG